MRGQRIYTNKTKLNEIFESNDPIISIFVNGKHKGNIPSKITLKANNSNHVVVNRIIAGIEVSNTYFITCLSQELDTPDKAIEKIIKKHGVLIGSRKWGGEIDSSDYDIAFPHNKMKDLMRYIDHERVTIGMYPDNRMQSSFSFYITLNKKKYNIIIYFNMDIIYNLNNVMEQKLLDKDFKEKMKTKAFRVQECEAILNKDIFGIDDFFK